MAITIPSDATKTFEKVMGALGGEDYSYYLFDVKNVNESDKAKKVVEMVVYVPQAQRVTAAANIQASLDGDGVVAEVLAKETELNVYLIGNVKKYIRLNVKPNGSKGSGGGAAATAIQEAAQCLYAAMRYYCGEKEIYNEDDLRCGMDHVDVGSTKLEEIMGLPKEWKEGSMKGANEIFEEVGGSGYKFVRGDRLLDDGSIKKAFGRVKGQTNLSSEDKWNPADIWAVRKSMKAQIAAEIKEIGTIGELNAYLQEKNASKDLVGFSLKKLGGSPTAKLLNADTPAQRKAALQASFHHYDLTFDNKRKGDKQYPMDVYYYYGSGNFQKFQARNFGGENKGDWKLELKGQFAAQGKIQGAVVAKVLTQAGFRGIPKEADWNKCRSNAPATVKKAINEEIYNLLKKYNAANLPTDKDSAMQIINMRPQAWKYSKLSGLRFLNYLKGLNGRADDAMKALYLYAGSQSDYSSVYYKLS